MSNTANYGWPKPVSGQVDKLTPVQQMADQIDAELKAVSNTKAEALANYVYYDYSTGVSTTNRKALTNQYGGALDFGDYIVTVMISATGTSLAANMYRVVYSSSTSTWSVQPLGYEATGSNRPQIQIENDVPTIFTVHSSDYTVQVRVEGAYGSNRPDIHRFYSELSDTYTKTTNLSKTPTGLLSITTDYGDFRIGAANADWCHLYTDRDKFYSDKPVHVKGEIFAGSNYNNKVWHAGNTLIDPTTGCIAPV